MFKRIFSIFLVLVLCFCIVFQCSFSSHAVFGVDDALLIAGLTCELLGAGITIYSVSQFVQSDTFDDFAKSVVDNIDRELSLIKLNGELFFSLSKTGWYKLQNWVKNHFSGATEDKIINYDVELSTSPEFLILNNGVTVPYSGFMEYPFFIYWSSGSNQYKAYYCTQKNAGMIVHEHDVQIYCTGYGSIHLVLLNGNTWSDQGGSSMTYGLTFRGETGSIFNLQFAPSLTVNTDSFYAYRTIDVIVSADGELNPNFNATQTVPDGTETETASVNVHSDGLKYPGAIDSPATNLSDGESMLVKVPDSLVVDDGQGNLTLTTDSSVIADTLAETTVADVEPKVLTDTASEGVDVVVDNVIADTANPSLSGNATADIETANKFRLPKSFLEGFPFSIPYSIFVGIKSLVANPVIPVYDIPFKIDRLHINENIHLDLSNFNPLAKLCRSLLALVWVAGLAMACSKFIKR